VPGGKELAALAWGASGKTVLPNGSIDRARLGWKSGAAIELAWDARLTPEVAVWVCNGDLGGYRQIAVEPATSSTVLGPGETFGWWLEIRGQKDWEEG